MVAEFGVRGEAKGPQPHAAEVTSLMAKDIKESSSSECSAIRARPFTRSVSNPWAQRRELIHLCGLGGIVDGYIAGKVEQLQGQPQKFQFPHAPLSTS